MEIKTKWVKPKVPMQCVDATSLVIADDKPIRRRVANDLKYDAVFRKMKPGQCVRCTPESANSVANALRKWILNNSDATKYGVKTVRCYPTDGMGRVWMTEKS